MYEHLSEAFRLGRSGFVKVNLLSPNVRQDIPSKHIGYITHVANGRDEITVAEFEALFNLILKEYKYVIGLSICKEAIKQHMKNCIKVIKKFMKNVLN